MKEKLVRININEIKDPDFVKSLGPKSLKILCHDLRHEIIRVTSTRGGHLSSNLGAVELTVSLHRSFNFPKDKLIFDVGHQAYTHKILTGRSLEHLNEKDGISGFQKISESVYDCYEAGHSSTSLSAAEAFAIARNQNKENYDVVAVIGDGSIVNGLAFEALNSISSRSDKVIIVLNDNEMSISKPAGSLGSFFRKISTQKFYNKAKKSYKRMLYRTSFGRGIYEFSARFKSRVKDVLVPTTMFDNMGFTYIGPVDGHNIKAMDQAFKRAKNTTKSVIVHVITKKGKGYERAEKDINGYWHGVTPFFIDTGLPKNDHPGIRSWSHFMSDCLEEVMAHDEKVVSICPAMVKGSDLDGLYSRFSNRCFDVGIAEEHALTLAGALSLSGLKPVVTIYSTFLQRAYDELSHDCARLKVDVTLLIERSGLSGGNGETHQGIYDCAFLSSIPGVTITMPSTVDTAKRILEECTKGGKGIVAIRYPRELTNESLLSTHDKTVFGRFSFPSIGKNKETIFIGVGPKGLGLFAKIFSKHPNVSYCDPIFLNSFNLQDIEKIATYKNVVVYDPYSTEEGFVKNLESALFRSGCKSKFVSFALPNSFIPHMSVKEQEELCEIDENRVLAQFEKLDSKI